MCCYNRVEKGRIFFGYVERGDDENKHNAEKNVLKKNV